MQSPLTRKQVSERFRILQNRHSNEQASQYWHAIQKGLILEGRYPDLFAQANKRIYYHFAYGMPEVKMMAQVDMNDYFLMLYNIWNPVRFAIETMDHIEQVRIDLSA